MGWIVLAGVMLCVGALLVVVTSWVIAMSLLRPPRMTDGKALYVLRRMSPADLGLPYERIDFLVRDQATQGADQKIKLAAWWIPHALANGRCVVMLHGYADAKVGVIAWAPMWHSLGFNILAIDLRAHGESDGSHTTGGYFEQHDVEQILDQIRDAHPTETRRIVLFGSSLGSAVALAVANRRSDLADAVVLECPFTSFANATTSHAERFGAPTRIIMPLALRFASSISGARFDHVQPIELMRTLSCPMLIIQAGDDSFVGHRDMDAIATAVADRSNVEVWRAAGAEHLLAIAIDSQRYRDHLTKFLNRLPAGVTQNV